MLKGERTGGCLCPFGLLFLKNAPDWVVQTTDTYFSEFCKLEVQEHGTSRFRVQAELSSWFIGGPFLAEYSHGTGGEGTLWSLFYKGTNHLPKAPPLHTITPGVRISRYEFWEDMTIQSRAEGELETEEERERDFS